MAYNNITSRTDAQALIPEDVVSDMIRRATDDSAVLTAFRRVPVTGQQTRIPVLSALPVAYWVTGDTGLKQTTELGWQNKFLNIEEAATILPVPENVVDDMDVDIWDEAMPYLVEALGRLVDSAVFFGTNAPASFPTNISSAAVAAGNTVAESLAATSGGFFGDIDALLATLDADGYDATGFVASTTAKGKFRAARNGDGDRLDRERLSGDLMSLDGAPVLYPMRGLFPSGTRLFAGDWSQFVVGVRKDVTVKVLDQAVIQDNNGTIIYNLAQQDMVALRVTFRVGWQVANIINYDNSNDATRYPAAVLTY